MPHSSILDQINQKVRNIPSEAIELATQALHEPGTSTELSVELMLAISRANIHQGMYAEGEVYAMKAATVSRQNLLRRLEGLSQNELGIYRFVHGEFDNALLHYMKALQLLEKAGRQTDIVKVYINIGNVHTRSGASFDAIYSYERALELLEGSNDVLSESKVLMNLSAMYCHVLSDTESALLYTTRAITHYRSLNDVTGLGKALINHGKFLRLQGRVEESIKACMEALELRKQFAEPDDVALCFTGLVAAYTELGMLDKAEKALEECHEILKTTSTSHRTQKLLLYPTATVRKNRGDLEGALESVEEGLEWSKDSMIGEYYPVFLGLKASITLELGRYEQAARFYKELNDLSAVQSRQRAEVRLLHIKQQVERAKAVGLEEAERIRNVELAQTVRKLESLSRENEEFIAFLAHELKNPLSTIRALAGWLASEKGNTAEEYKEIGVEIKQTTSYMFDMITRVLVGSKSRMLKAMHIVDARLPLHQALSAQMPIASQKGIQFDYTVPSEAMFVKGEDPILLSVFENLISNAVKYTPSTGSVRVCLETVVPMDVPPVLRFSVVDTGPGLAQDEMSRLFSPFGTLSSKPTANESSTGLGLHLVKRAVDQLDGQVWCESEFGKGATFVVELPLVPASEIDQET